MSRQAKKVNRKTTMEAIWKIADREFTRAMEANDDDAKQYDILTTALTNIECLARHDLAHQPDGTQLPFVPGSYVD